MALSGTYRWPCIFNLDNYSFLAVPENESDIVFTLNWTATQDVVNNKSTINWEVKAQLKGFEYTKRTLTSFNTWGDGATGIVVGNTGSGSTWKDFTLSIREVNASTLATNTIDNLYLEILIGETKTIASGTNILPHNDDGSLEIYFAPNIRVCDSLMPWATPISSSSEDGGYRFSYSAAYAALDDISRHAVIVYNDENSKVKDFTDEDASVAIKYAMPSGMTAQLYLSLDGNANTESTHLVTVTGADTHNYTFSDADRRKMWALLDQGLDNKQVRFFIKSTAEDGTLFREPSNLVNLRIVNYMPTLDPRVEDSNPATVALTGDSEKLIRYASTAKFTTGAQAKKHYSISTESCANGGGNPVYGATGEIPNVASNHFVFSATDNAGRRVQTGHEVPEEYGYWIPYVKLTCSATTTEMTADGDVQITVTGQYFNGSFGEQLNTLKITCTYAENNGEPQTRTYTNVSPTMDGNNYTYSFTLDGLHYLSVYEVQITAEDKVMPQPAVANIVVASTPIFDWGRTDFAFNVPVTIQGDSVPSIVEQGTTYAGWNYRKWSDGLYECWQRKVINTMLKNASSATGWYTSGAVSATNLSYPITFTEIPTVNVNLSPTTNTWALLVPGSTPGTTEETGNYQLLATYTHDTNRDYIFNYQVKGKWK